MSFREKSEYSIQDLVEITGVEYGTVWLQMKKGYCAYPCRLKTGRTLHPLHTTWYHMIRRCENPRSDKYKHYGARGISVCERWHNFQNFLEDMGPRPEGMTLDRINNSGNYEPGNCRWATSTEQNNNKRPGKKKNHYGIRKHGNKYHVIFQGILYRYDSLEEAVVAKEKMYGTSIER